MKLIASSFLLIIWMVLSIAAICTLIGIIVVVDEDFGWSSIPKNLLQNLKN